MAVWPQWSHLMMAVYNPVYCFLVIMGKAQWVLLKHFAVHVVKCS